MPNLIDELKKLEKPKSWRDFIELICALVAVVGGVYTCYSNFVDALVAKPYVIICKCFAIYLIILLIGIVYCIKKASATSSKTIIILDEPNVNYRKRTLSLIFSFCRVYSFGLMVFAIALTGIFLREKKDCIENSNILDVVVTNFSKDSNDVFSSNLFDYLNKEVSDSSKTIEYPNKFLEPMASSKQRKGIISLLGCHNSGIIIYGAKNYAEKSFYCNLYLHNMESACYRLSVKDKIIPIRDPKLIEIDNVNVQAAIIGKFIKSILAAYQCDERESILLLDNIITDTASRNCKQLLAYCYLIKGNNLVRLNEIEKAKKCYMHGLEFDNLNGDLKLNAKLLKSILKKQKSKEDSKTEVLIAKNGIYSKIFIGDGAHFSTAGLEKSKFVKGTMRVTYTGESDVATDFNNLHFRKQFTVHNKPYFFTGDNVAHGKKGSNGIYYYIFNLLPSKIQNSNYTEMDFLNAACEISVYDKNSVKMDSPNISIEIKLKFSNKTELFVKKKNIKIL